MTQPQEPQVRRPRPETKPARAPGLEVERLDVPQRRTLPVLIGGPTDYGDY